MPSSLASEKAVADTVILPENGLPAVTSEAKEDGGSMLDHAKRLFDLGCSALRSEQYDEACDCLSKALEIRVQQYGELAIECAPSFYKYGCALLYKVQSQSDALGPAAAAKEKSGLPSTEATLRTVDEDEDDEGSEDEGVDDGDVEEEADGEADGEATGDGADEDELNEGETDLQLAWENLDVARMIYERQPQRSIEEVDVITALADISLEKEEFDCCFADYTRALGILEKLVEPDDRGLVELYFKIALALQLSNKAKDALTYCKKAVSICEARLERLKTERGKQPAHAEPDKEPEPEKEPECAEEKEVRASHSKLSAEIIEIDGLLVDLREKVSELQEMTVGPSLMEALQAVNPSAADSVKQLFSVVASMAGCGEIKPTGSPTQSSSSNGFDAAAVSGSGHVTDLGVVGRGVKRAAPAPIATSSTQGASSDSAQPVAKKRSLEDMMNGGPLGWSHPSFGQAESVEMAGSSGRRNDGTTGARGLLANSAGSMTFTPECSATSATDIVGVPASPATSFQS